MFYGAEIANKKTAQKSLAVGTTTNVPAYAGTANMDERKYLVIWNGGTGGDIFYSYSSSLAAANRGSISSGMILDGEEKVFPIGPAITLYMLATAATIVSVTEIA